MIQLKEINPREYMKGTKAWRFQLYLWLGLVGFSVAVSAPILYFSYKKVAPAREEMLRQREEEERIKLQQVAQLYEQLQKAHDATNRGM